MSFHLGCNNKCFADSDLQNSDLSSTKDKKSFQIYDLYVEKETPTTHIHREDAYIDVANDEDDYSVLQNANISYSEISEEVNTISAETPSPLAASRFPQEEAAVECPMQENLASCDIFLCRVFRNMLALPFPDCYASRF